MNEPLSKDPRAVGLGHDLQPQVDLPREAIPMPLLIALTVALAIGLFLYLDADRRARLDTPSAAKPLRLQPPPPPLLIPPAPEPVATPAALATPAGPQSAMVAPTKPATRMDSPAVAQVKAVSAPPPMAIARSLVELDPESRPALKKAGLLTRDARRKETKKYGSVNVAASGADSGYTTIPPRAQWKLAYGWQSACPGIPLPPRPGQSPGPWGRAPRPAGGARPGC